MEVISEKVFVDIPLSDIVLFKQLADKMGWKVVFQQNLWSEYAGTCPKNVDLSDDDIMAEVRAVRYEE
jgi:hypothetical protein